MRNRDRPMGMAPKLVDVMKMNTEIVAAT